MHLSRICFATLSIQPFAITSLLFEIQNSQINIYFQKKMDQKLIFSNTQEEDKGKVYKIELNNKNLQKITSLKTYVKLRCLCLDYNFIETIENISSLTDLRELHLASNSIMKINNLESNKSLQVLDLSHNRIEKIENITHLIKLETLLLDQNHISKLACLEYLNDLKHLSVCNNNLESIENLPSFSKMEVLMLSHNKISKVSANLFNASNKLIKIDLSHNFIEKTDFLQHLSSLEMLKLSNNVIKQLNLGCIMNNLEILNISHNQIDALPFFKTVCPELITLDLADNQICSEIQLIQALADATSLTELDFTNNPMHSQAFQQAIQKIHHFDYLNGNVINSAGSKYYEEIEQIQNQIQNNSNFYEQDDQDDRKLKFSGFFNEDLQYKMTGMKPNRPSSPLKKKISEKATFYEDLQKSYKQFTENDMKIKIMRQHYLKICEQNNIKGDDHSLNEITMDMMTEPEFLKKTSSEQIVKFQEEFEKKDTTSSKVLEKYENQFRKENEKNVNKWKELKQREKSFNIRDAIKKTSKKEASVSRISSGNSHIPSTITTTKYQFRAKSDLFKTQMNPRRNINQMELLRSTMGRPPSSKKREE